MQNPNEELEMFVGEVGECLDAIEDGVLQLEQRGAQPEIVNRLFTATHNIKGASSIFGFPELEKLAHSMEDILTAVRKTILDVSPSMVDVFLSAKDMLRSLLSSFAAGARLPESKHIIEQLRAFLSRPASTGEVTKSKEELHRALLDKTMGQDLTGAFLVFVFLNPGCRLLEVRLIQLDRTISKLGDVLLYVPEGPSIQDNIPASHEKLVALNTTLAPEEIKQAILKLPDVIEVIVEPFSKIVPVHPPKELSAGGAAEDITTAALAVSEHTLRIPILTLSQFSQKVAEVMGDFSRIRQFLTSLKNRRSVATVFELAGVEEVVEHVQLMLDQLQEDSIEMRFIPLDTLFSQFRRMVRKLSKELGKDVNLEIRGGEVKLDGAVVEKIKEPLVHIIRNSMDHGLETPEERRETGKKTEAFLSVSASSMGGYIQIIVEDDGRGIIADMVVTSAIEKGLITRESATKLTNEEILELLFAPGFSTRKNVTELSGRGVGLDVVKKNLEEIKGNCRIETDPGKGTRFIIQVPSTTLIQRLLFFTVGGRNFAMPLSDIVEIVTVKKQDLLYVLDRVCLQMGKETVSVFSLDKILGLTWRQKEKERLLLIIVRTFSGKVAFVIEEIQQEAERVIKPLPHVISHINTVLGVTLNDLGEAMPVLNPLHLISMLETAQDISMKKVASREKSKVPLAMVVDDSQLTREVVRDILEREGYRVEALVNGREAVEYANNITVDLVVTDIDMPEMNGFELLRTLRAQEEYSRVPIVVVSGKISKEEKQLGLELGASAYLDKADLQKHSFVNLLQTLGK